MKESLILDKLPGDKHTWTWNLDPGDLTPRLTDEDALELVDASGTVVMWSPTPVAWDASQTDPNKPRDEQTLDASLVRTADGGWVYKVNVDADWLQSKDRVFPVTIDPEMTVTPVNQNSYKTNGAQYIGQLHVGNTNEVAGGYFWRAIENFAGGAAVGQFIEGSNLTINYLNGSTAAGAGVVRVATGWCYTCLGTQLGGYTLSTGSVVVGPNAFRQYIADQFGFGGTTNVAFMISGGESSAYTYKQISSSLWIKYHAQITPSQVTTGTGASPTNGATGVSLTPSFKSTSTAAATGSSLAYSFRIGLDANFSQMVYTSPETTTPTATVPPGILKPGTKYYWRAYVHDLGWDGVWGQSTLFSTGAWSFTTNQVPYPANTATAIPGNASAEAPAVVSTHTPKLSVSGLAVTDSDSSTAMTYRFTVSNADGSGTVATSALATPDASGMASWDVPVGILHDGETYNWTVAAYDGKDLYTPSPATLERTFEVESSRLVGSFVAMNGEVANTTTGMGTPHAAWAAKAPQLIQVTGVAGVPTTDVSAVAVSITTISPSATGVVSVGPGTGSLADAMRYRAGTNTTASSIVGVDENGQIQVQASTATDASVHIQGYYSSTPGQTSASPYVAVPMTRIANTLAGTGLPQAPISGGQSVAVQVTGVAGIPVGARAAFLNFQVNNNTSGASGYINPYGASASGALRFPGTTTSTSLGALVPLDAAGIAHIYVGPGNSVDLIVDAEGYLPVMGATASGSALTIDAGRLFDSTNAAHSTPGATTNIPLSGVADIPSMKLGLRAAVVNLTVIDPGSAGGTARAWAHGAAEPTGSTSIAFSGGSTSNLIIVPVGADGSIDIHNVSGDTVDYVVDLVGWYAVPPQPTISCPAPYSAGTWTTTVPSAPISCTVHVPDTADPAGVVDVAIDEGEVNETALPGTGTLDLPAVVPAVAGWHVVTVSALYSDGLVAQATYSFGVQDGTPSVLIAAIQNVMPAAFENITTGPTSASSQVAVQTSASESTSGSAEVAKDPAVGITLSQSAQSQTDPDSGETTTTPATNLQVELPSSLTASDAHVEAPGIVSYDNHNGSHTVTIVKNDTSVQNFTIIDGPTAPSSYTYAMNVPAGSTVALDPDTGMVTATDASGTQMGLISPAWAKDATGADLPTHYVVSGTNVTQVIDLTSPSITYPVVADPYVGTHLFVVRAWYPHGNSHNPGKPTIMLALSLYGTLLHMGFHPLGGPLFSFWAAGQKVFNTAGWAEVTRAIPAAATKATYHQQYLCHVVGAYPPFTGGPTWDFEGQRANRPNWRTDGGLTRWGCNWPV